MSSAALAFETVACLRGGRLLFEELSFSLEPGDAAMVTGPNGIGKSSLLRLAAGLLAPSAGSIRREGRLSLADENAALDRHLALARAVGFWVELDGGEDCDTVRGLAAMDLLHLSEVPVRMLSTGQRKRATLARVIAGNAPVWLLDEPANGLDGASLVRLEAAMAAHRAAGGIVLAASHLPLGLSDAQTIALGAA